jgi:hypothetical protein
VPFPTATVTPGSGLTVNTLPNSGQATSANSLPVVVASDQSVIPFSAAALPLPAGAAIEAGNLATIVTEAGALTETAPATDTASSGLNGRLQRIAQRITSLIALVPVSLGQKAMASSFAVVVSSDQSAIPISAATLPLPTGAATAAGSPSIATAQVTVTTGNITVCAARAGLFAVTVINHGTTDVFLGITGVTTANGAKLKGTDGASITFPTSAAIFGTVSSGTQAVSVLETF